MQALSSFTFILFLASCTDGGSAGGPSIAGTYHGELAIDHDVPERSVFTSATLVLDEDGGLAGSMLTSKSPSVPVGEMTSVTGSIVMTSASFGDAELVMAFPTFGAFTASGTITYADATHVLSGRLLARDDSGTIIGNALISVMQ